LNKVIIIIIIIIFSHTKSILITWWTYGWATVVTWTILNIVFTNFLGWQVPVP